jgi:hypothetical protein
MKGKGDRNVGLAGYLFGVAYNAGLNLLSGNFSALTIGSDADDATQVCFSHYISVRFDIPCFLVLPESLPWLLTDTLECNLLSKCIFFTLLLR